MTRAWYHQGGLNHCEFYLIRIGSSNMTWISSYERSNSTHCLFDVRKGERREYWWRSALYCFWYPWNSLRLGWMYFYIAQRSYQGCWLWWQFEGVKNSLNGFKIERNGRDFELPSETKRTGIENFRDLVVGAISSPIFLPRMCSFHHRSSATRNQIIDTNAYPKVLPIAFGNPLSSSEIPRCDIA